MAGWIDRCCDVSYIELAVDLRYAWILYAVALVDVGLAAFEDWVVESNEVEAIIANSITEPGGMVFSYGSVKHMYPAAMFDCRGITNRGALPPVGGWSNDRVRRITFDGH